MYASGIGTACTFANLPCDTRRGEKVGALYSNALSPLAVISLVHSTCLPCTTEYGSLEQYCDCGSELRLILLTTKTLVPNWPS